MNLDLSIISSILFVVIGATFFGSRAGIQIIRKNKNEDWIGIKTSFLILMTFALARIPFDMDYKNVIQNFRTIKNFFGGLLFVIASLTIPTIVYGIFIGRGIKKYVR